MRIFLVLAALFLAVCGAVAQQNVPTLNGAVAAVSAAATGTTGAVTATLPGVAGKVTYVCGFDVSEQQTATAGPYSATVSGLLNGTFTYQASNLASAGSTISRSFTPCVPASNANTAITITANANANASAVDVNAWGFQQ